MHSLLSLRGRVFGPALHICAACGGDFANPAAWEQAGPAAWVVRLRCGACGHERDAEVGKAAARRFDRALDRGFDAIERAADLLEHRPHRDVPDRPRARPHRRRRLRPPAVGYAGVKEA